MACNVTSSSSRNMPIRGTHNFKIHDFSYLKGMELGNYITSDTFSVGGHQWQIHFYPDGNKKYYSGDIYVSVFIFLVNNSGKDIKVWFEYYLLDQNGNRWGISNTLMEANQRNLVGPITMNKVTFDWGYNYFYKRRELEKSQFIKDDCFTIQCTVHVATTETKLPQPLSLSDLKQNYEELFESMVGSDISFEVEGEIFYAHKIILSARSPVFKAQFFGPLKVDDKTQRVKIEEIQAPVFKALLHFIYCDVIPDLDSDCEGTIMTQHLLAAADRYGIPTLKSLCESRLCDNIAIDTVASTLALAEQHGCFQLKSRCLEFSGRPENFEAVICDLLKFVVRGSDLS